MTGDGTRLVAWADEMRRAHSRLRDALSVVRTAAEAGEDVPAPERELLLFCHGFCAALGGHHEAEDGMLLPALRQQQPELAPVIERLTQDHEAISRLLHDLRDALDRRLPPDRLLGHLDGIGAIVESHFRYEERELLPVLAGVRLDLGPRAAFGDL
ncbi:hypothetical protein GCM10009623_06810 [Nocardioides aestuarii]|uniref:Hemerythrin domain-containing protein n=1 Tax=Nocardioides aestuarii TaxID=252231 RepID=A0ABW4TFH2_9ACTN